MTTNDPDARVEKLDGRKVKLNGVTVAAVSHGAKAAHDPTIIPPADTSTPAVFVTVLLPNVLRNELATPRNQPAPRKLSIFQAHSEVWQYEAQL